MNGVDSGAWIIFPTYMLWILGRDVKRGLELAAAVGGRKKDQ